MTEAERQRTVGRLCGWLGFLSDRVRLASIEEACLAELYLNLSDVCDDPLCPLALPERSEVRQELTRALFAKSASERLRMLDRGRRFAERVTGADWARPQLLRSWMVLAAELEKARPGVRCGRPKWATAKDYEAAGLTPAD